MSSEGGAINLRLIENSRYVLAWRFLVVAARWPNGEPHTAEIRDDHPVIADQVFCKRHPHVAGLAVAVQQHDCRPQPPDAYMQLSAVRCDVLSTEALGEREFSVSSLGCHETPLLAGLAPPGRRPTVATCRMQRYTCWMLAILRLRRMRSKSRIGSRSFSAESSSVTNLAS